MLPALLLGVLMAARPAAGQCGCAAAQGAAPAAEQDNSAACVKPRNPWILPSLNIEPAPPGQRPGLTFMLNSQLYLHGIQAIDPVVAEHFFNTPRAILFTNTSNYNPVPAGWTSTAGMKFSSFAKFAAAVANNNIDAHVSVVIYDNEKWMNSGMTPHNEQIAPASYTAQFGSLARYHCYAFMATPSRDLTQDQLDYTGGALDDYYLARGQYQDSGENFPPWAASSANVFDIQAQAHTIDGQYLSFATAADAQAIAANPNIKILIGLSTTYGTAQDMYNALLNTYQLPNVVGYWINVPSPNATTYKQVVDFLHMVQAAGL